MPPVRRSGPAGPRPSRRPRVAGTRGIGPAATPGDGDWESDPDVEPSPALEQEAVRTAAVVAPAPVAATVELPPVEPSPVEPSPVEPSPVEPQPARETFSPSVPVSASEPSPDRPAEHGATPAVVIRKVPRAAAAEPVEVGGADPGAETPGTTTTTTTTARRRGLRGAVVVLALAVLLGAFAVVASFKPGTATTADNTAFVDTAATGEVAAAAINAVQKTYSYSFSTIGSDLTAATDLMTPDMASKHQANIATIKDAVTQAKTTSKAQVTADGVRTLQGDRAEVVAFVVVTSDNGGTALAPVPLRFTAQMQRVGGTWKLSGLVPS